MKSYPKNEIKDYLSYTKLDSKEIKALLKTNSILNNCYMAWLKADGNFYENLECVIDKTIKD